MCSETVGHSRWLYRTHQGIAGHEVGEVVGARSQRALDANLRRSFRECLIHSRCSVFVLFPLPFSQGTQG